MKRRFFPKIDQMVRTAITTGLLTSIPMQGICASLPLEHIVMNLMPSPPPTFPPFACTIFIPSISQDNAFDGLADLIRDAKDPLATTKQFLQAYIDQLNLQHGTSLSMEEVCAQLRKEKNAIPSEYHEVLLVGVEALEANVPEFTIPPLAASIHIPRDWIDIEKVWEKVKEECLSWLSWFTDNKKEIKKDPFSILSAKIAQNPTTVLIFACFAAAVTLIAIYNPPAVTAAVEAMAKVLPLFLQ